MTIKNKRKRRYNIIKIDYGMGYQMWITREQMRMLNLFNESRVKNDINLWGKQKD